MGVMGPDDVAPRGVSLRVESHSAFPLHGGGVPVGWRVVLLPAGTGRSESRTQEAEGVRAGGAVTAPARLGRTHCRSVVADLLLGRRSPAFSWSVSSWFRQFGAMQHISSQTGESVGQAALSCGGDLLGHAAQDPTSQRPQCRFPPPHCWDVWVHGGHAPWDRHRTLQAAAVSSLTGPRLAGEGL